MPFVPVVPTQRAASARAQDLGRRLKAEVEKFETQYPGTSREDLRAAAALAIGEESVTVPPRRQATAIVVALIVSLGVLGALLEMGSTTSGGPAQWRIAAVGIAIACVGALAVARRRNRR
jgi:hypothetical protein